MSENEYYYSQSVMLGRSSLPLIGNPIIFKKHPEKFSYFNHMNILKINITLFGRFIYYSNKFQSMVSLPPVASETIYMDKANIALILLHGMSAVHYFTIILFFLFND